MALTDVERTELHRQCGYPVAAASGAAAFLDLRSAALTAAEQVVLRRYLATLAGLEAAVPKASDSLDTDQAAVWTRNQHEVRDRLVLLDEWRRRLCGFLGVRPGPALAPAGTRIVI